MGEINVVSMCVSSFITVFCVLAFLAILMKLLIALFPYKNTDSEEEKDAGVIAAIHSTYSAICPGSRVTEIKEIT